MKAARKMPSAKCPECGKVIRLRPCGGDWLNAIFVIRHRKPSGDRCDGHFTEIETKDIIEPARPAALKTK